MMMKERNLRWKCFATDLICCSVLKIRILNILTLSVSFSSITSIIIEDKDIHKVSIVVHAFNSGQCSVFGKSWFIGKFILNFSLRYKFVISCFLFRLRNKK